MLARGRPDRKHSALGLEPPVITRGSSPPSAFRFSRLVHFWPCGRGTGLRLLAARLPDVRYPLSNAQPRPTRLVLDRVDILSSNSWWRQPVAASRERISS